MRICGYCMMSNHCLLLWSKLVANEQRTKLQKSFVRGTPFGEAGSLK